MIPDLHEYSIDMLLLYKIHVHCKYNHFNTIKFIIAYTVFCSGYLEWLLDSTLHLVLFIQFILNSVSVAYICII